MYKIFFTACLFFIKINCFAQVPAPDTLRIIEILRGLSLREKTIDSLTKIETIAGDVMLKEGATTFSCDSAIINRKLNTLEAFGNVHINDADSLHTYAQYVKYIGTERIAYLKKNVRLTDKKGTLLTQDLVYDLKAGIGKYHNGGKVINGATVLTSSEGTYYADTKDVMFKNNVDLTDPKYKIKADSLLYNTNTQVVTFTGPTHIKSKEANIFTTEGTYDLKNGNAFFGSRTLIKDTSGRVYQANRIALEEKSGQAQLEGNAIIKDSANGVIVTANIIFMNRDNSFLATQKPVMIIQQQKDSIYIAADTLFSGFTTRTTKENKKIKKDSSVTLPLKKSDSLIIAKNVSDCVNSDSLDTRSVLSYTNRKTKVISLTKKDSSVRYFLAFHHVRVFSDSLQSVSDSLFYSAEDSTFRLFQDPVVWSGESQVTGDTIFLFTKNKKVERLYVFENSMIINKSSNNYYNQIAGRTTNGYFKDGVINYVRVRGQKAESIYYAQDKDSAYVGMNRATGDVIDMYFLKNQLDKVKFINDVHGIMHPMNQIPEDQKYLKNFKWQDKRRPKNKLELFE
jgi:lipopolysaccharide export system protein LptA